MAQMTMVALAITGGSPVQKHRTTELPVMRVSELPLNIRLIFVIMENHSIQNHIDLIRSIDHAPVESETTRTGLPIQLVGSTFPAQLPTCLPLEIMSLLESVCRGQV